MDPIFEALTEMLARTAPIDQAEMWGESSLYPWQDKVLRNLFVPDGGREVLCTPNGTGKTSVVNSLAILGCMSAFPGSRVVCTAGVERQLNDQLWPVVEHKVKRYPRWHSSGESIVAPSVDGLPPSKCTKFSAKDAESAEGYHERWYTDKYGKKHYAPLLMIIDEAKAVKSGIYEAWFRCNPDFWLVISTPGESTGPFYDLMHDATGYWSPNWVKRGDCPHLLLGKHAKLAEYLIEKMGIDSPLVMSMLFGQFFRSGVFLVFDDMALVDYAMSSIGAKMGHSRFAALEFAGGGDEQGMAIREGNEVVFMEMYREKDTDKLASMVLSELRRRELEPDQVIADDGGLGQAIIDNIEGRGFRGIRRYRFNAAPRDKLLFRDRAAEDAWTLRGWIQKRVVRLPNDQKLKDQMRDRRYEMPDLSGNRIQLESKKKIRAGDKNSFRAAGRSSPDRLDLMVMLFSEMLDYTTTSETPAYLRTEGPQPKQVDQGSAPWSPMFGMNSDL